MKHLAIRMATLDDVVGIQKLLNHYASLGDLLPRTRQDIKDNIQHFRVIEIKHNVIACGSLEYFSDELAEVRSLMVNKKLMRSGLGQLIVEQIIDDAKQNNVKRLMALTYVPTFFHKLGFKTVDKSIFPEKVWGICVNCYKFHNCNETAVLLEL